jgi:hypothetical protein
MDGPAYVDELRSKVIIYVQAHPSFPVLTLDKLVRECSLSSPCAGYLPMSTINGWIWPKRQ